MKNLPPKIRFIILTVALIGIIGLWYMAWRTAAPKTTNDERLTTNAPTNNEPDFVKIGTMTFNNPGLKENTPYFIFEEPGSPALSKELIIDKNSLCSSGGQPLTCFLMAKTITTTYEGQRVRVEGVSQPDGSLLIKKISLEK